MKERLKRKKRNRRYSERESSAKSLDSTRNKIQEITIANTKSNSNINNINLPTLSENNIESSTLINNNNTINLTLKSDKFVIISNNENDKNPSSMNLLPNVYQNSRNVSFNNIYPSRESIGSEKNRRPNINSTDLIINNTFVSSYPDKNNDISSIGIDFYTKKQLKNAERNYEKKIHMLKNQEKLYKEEMFRKQLDKKNMNVNFQINEVKTQ
ncbi:hypothetical protein PIROE2DRAFT_58769 [Piromyces sp. E2]|nr:hypothetical protein PIROE2DRAFT_58769 [Piromyces sp. E2]|eukprot:OUM67470.1 hypothetical protein PIROE2DRAFT_58769 [Piromyces sp. E2]